MTQVDLEQDVTLLPEVQEASTQTGLLLREAKVTAVKDDDDEAAAGQVLVRVKGLLKAQEKARKALVDPLNQHVKRINDVFREGKTDLEEAERILKDRIGAYRRDVEETRMAELAEARAREEQAIAAADDIVDAEVVTDGELPVVPPTPVAAEVGTEVSPPEQPPAPVTFTPPPPQTRKVEGGGSVTTTKVWKFEVVNEYDLPRDYLQADERMIRDAVAAGVRQIPGVRIFEDFQVAVGTAR